MNLLELMEHSADCYPDTVALQDSNTKYTYREYKQLSQQVGAAITKHLI